MTEKELVKQLLKLRNAADRRSFLEKHKELLNDEVARLLDLKYAHYLRSKLQRALEITDLLCQMSMLTGNPIYKAASLALEADARNIGMGEYEYALTLYDESTRIYQSRDMPEQAWSQLGKVVALSHLGRYEEALEIGQRISPVLEAQGWKRSLANVTVSMGNVYSRRGQDSESLAMYDRAVDLYWQIGKEIHRDWAVIQQNRSVALRNLGRFNDSLDANQKAQDTFLHLKEKIEAARAKQSLARTYFIIGRFNEALELLDHVRDAFLTDGRKRDAVLVELDISDCLLALRRFPDVIEKCQHVRGLFSKLRSRREEALAIVNEAIAYAELKRFEDALQSLSEARQIFTKLGNQVQVSSTDLERSAVFLCQGQYSESLALARECVAVFREHNLPIEAAQAVIVAARAALALKQYSEVDQFLKDALRAGEEFNIPTVRYQGHALLGTLAAARGDLEIAQKEYDRAIEEVEQLRGRLMVEFRVSFLEDKEALYQDMVSICLDQGQASLGLEYAERAKSRALLDLLAYRLDLTIQAKSTTDAPLVQELTLLRTERDHLYRRWESEPEETEKNERGWSASQSQRQQTQMEVLFLEKKITELWHRLLIRNADYAREAALWAVRTESAMPYLDDDTILVEYYVVRGKPVVFLVTHKDVQAIPLNCDMLQLKSWMQRLQLNLQTVPKSSPQELPELTVNAKGILRQLNQLLVSPVEDRLSRYSKLIIVPHGALHYLPFHALYDGSSYLVERYQISYLPSSSSLRYCREPRSTLEQSVIVGNSNHNRLPHALEESRMIATLLNGQLLLEQEASLEEVYKAIPNCRIVHLAAHGDFHLENPLFSGLSLADGWLTTIDIFNLRLQASLVTLSACQTGRNVLGGGDELLGLMRAFLSGGAASVVITLWAVEDRSTARLMESFYRSLTIGKDKGQALRSAQLQLIQKKNGVSDEPQEPYDHPYFWAPFFLVGDAGPL